MKKPFKFVSLFSGIEGFGVALDRLGGECVMRSEIDKYASQALEILYSPSLNRGDITKIDAASVPDHDILVGGFPCQAFSVAGKQLGFEDTRGTLFFEVARIAKIKQPKLMLLENVKGLVSHDGGRTLETIIRALGELNYAVDYKVLNSKHFGVPQNRERIFIVAARDVAHEDWVLPAKMDVVARSKRSIQGIEGIKTFNFDWPTNDTVSVRLVDILEDIVDEKYYLSDEKTENLLAQLNERHAGVTGRFLIDDQGRTTKELTPLDVSPTLRREMHGNEPRVVEPVIESNDDIQVLGRLAEMNGHDLCKRVYGVDGVSPTIPTGSSGNTTPKIAVQMNRNEIFKETDLSHCLMARDWKGYGNQEMTGIIEGTGCSLRTRSYMGQPQQLEVRPDSISNTITSVEKDSMVVEVRAVLTPDRGEKAQNGRRFKEDGEEMFTLTSQDIHGVAIIQQNQQRKLFVKDEVGSLHASMTNNQAPKVIYRAAKWRIRKLTPLECFRLQSFSDETFDALVRAKISNTQLYKMAGNAVTVNVIESIGSRLVNYL